MTVEDVRVDAARTWLQNRTWPLRIDREPSGALTPVLGFIDDLPRSSHPSCFLLSLHIPSQPSTSRNSENGSALKGACSQAQEQCNVLTASEGSGAGFESQFCLVEL